MTTVFHTWMCGRFIEILSNLGRKKLHRTNQGSNFLGGSFNNIGNVSPNLNPPSNLQEKVNPRILKGDFSSRTDCSIFTSIAPVLLDRSNETSSCPSQCLVDQIQVQKQILVVAMSQMSDPT